MLKLNVHWNNKSPIINTMDLSDLSIYLTIKRNIVDMELSNICKYIFDGKAFLVSFMLSLGYFCLNSKVQGFIIWKYLTNIGLKKWCFPG
jgi:hypothetical protein